MINFIRYYWKRHCRLRELMRQMKAEHRDLQFNLARLEAEKLRRLAALDSDDADIRRRILVGAEWLGEGEINRPAVSRQREGELVGFEIK